VVGGVIASLGSKNSPEADNNRSFFFAPDVAKIIAHDGSNYYNISIGSGNLVAPNTDLKTADRFYSIRDYHLEPMTQSQFNTAVPVIDSGKMGLSTINGVNQVALPDGNRGWKLPLRVGEKVLARAVTINGSVMFTTYLPAPNSTDCTTPASNRRAYTLDVQKGIKLFDELYESFSASGLPSGITLINQGALVRTDINKDSPTAAGNARGSLCWSGVTILKRCPEFGGRVKTFWKDSGIN
jgi:hypothetical protein